MTSRPKFKYYEPNSVLRDNLKVADKPIEWMTEYQSSGLVILDDTCENYFNENNEICEEYSVTEFSLEEDDDDDLRRIMKKLQLISSEDDKNDNKDYNKRRRIMKKFHLNRLGSWLDRVQKHNKPSMN